MGQFCRAHRSIRPHALSNFHQNLLWNLVLYGCHKWLQNKQCGRRVRPTRYAPPASNPDLWPFDLETGMRVASMAGKLSSKFGHARPLDSRIICYVRDVRTERRTDGRTDKSNAYCPLFYGRGHNIGNSLRSEPILQMRSNYRRPH